MTDSRENAAGADPALEAAARRLDAALARLESGLGALADKASDGTGAGSGAREAALEAALQEASGTMGALIAEVREAILAAQDAAPDPEGADGEG